MTPLWTTHDLKTLFGGEKTHLLKEATGISIDTRTLEKGDLFIALKGPLANGHDYLKQAFERGAVGAVIDRKPHGIDTKASLACFVTPNTFEALQQMGVYQRKRAHGQIAAVTGSYGKTSCKEALFQLLSRQGKTHATKRSFNNHWGVPLSLSTLPPQARYGIFEVGMNHPGEIAPLSRMIRPHVGLITTVAAAHIGNMGSLQAIAEEKASLFEGMAPGGVAIINKESAESASLIKKAQDHHLEVLTFGSSPQAFARLKEANFTAQGFEIKAEISGRSYCLKLPVLQKHWGLSALGVLATIHALGGDVDQAAEDFKKYIVPEGRGRHHVLTIDDKAIRVLDESYNAGPASMKEAIEALGRLCPEGRGRRIAILSDMLELGAQTESAHKKLGLLLEAAGVDLVYTVGQHSQGVHESLSPDRLKAHLSSPQNMEGFIEKIINDVQPGDIYLIKGSRGQRAYRGILSQVVEAFRKAEGKTPPLKRSL